MVYDTTDTIANDDVGRCLSSLDTRTDDKISQTLQPFQSRNDSEGKVEDEVIRITALQSIHDIDGDICDQSNDGCDVNTTSPISWLNLTNPLLPDTFNYRLGYNSLPSSQTNNNESLWVQESKFTLKLFKFTVITYSAIAFWYWVVRLIGWEHDDQLKLNDLYTYESPYIATDILFFYVVGRVYDKPGVDNCLWIATILTANFYNSYITGFKIFQHSFTLYEMHCSWPWQLWIFVIFLIPLLSAVGILHLIYAYKYNILVSKTVEMLLCLFFTFLPYVGSPYFHLHHWYAGWLVGMHFNFSHLWSQVAMAWCWGCYINGIAVYGRDPVLTCGYALFVSEDQRCPFMQCYTQAVFDFDHNIDTNNTQKPMEIPDWRNCSSSYKP